MHSRMFPPISAIRAVEAAVRLCGFRAAAAELGVSQSAVSQSVRQLERQLGLDMFVRVPGRLAPTPAGQAYAAAVAPALGAILSAALNVLPGQAIELRFGCSRALLNHWLLPRLPRPSEESAKVFVQALEREPSDLSGFDIAVVNGTNTAPPFDDAQLLRSEVLVAVGAPSLVRALGGALENSPGLRDAVLLGSNWEAWGQQAAAAGARANGLRLRETSALMAAVRAGEGFALLPALVCADAVRDGQLALASAVTVDRSRGYWLVQGKATERHTAALAGWLRHIFANSPDALATE